MKNKLLMLFGLLAIASMLLAACGGAAPTAAPATSAPATQAPATEAATEAPATEAATEAPSGEPVGAVEAPLAAVVGAAMEQHLEPVLVDDH